LKSTTFHAYEEISVKLLKTSSECIISPITYICNKSLSTGIFPDRLKCSEVKPIYKKDDKDNMNNYRPIYLLTSFSKIFEKVIFIRMYKHLKNNNILAKQQFGFTQHSSMEKHFTN
jgi:Notch-like protein